MVAKRILLVEDDQDIRETLNDLLLDEGYEVILAGNGQEGLDVLNRLSELPHLILLDLMMPVKNGFQFSEEKDADDRLKNIPVIVMSADGHVREKQSLINAEAYIKKPLDIFELLDQIAKIAV